MIAAIDVQYTDDTAQAGLVLFEKWTDKHPATTIENVVENCAPYIAGKFFRRELPVIIQTLNLISQNQTPHAIVVDCYVDLYDDKPGLGRYLFNALNEKAVVIGVAKSQFRDSKLAIEICRGNSNRRLFVTAAGIESQEAAVLIESMEGNFRIPKLLKLADSIARFGIQN